MTIYYHELMEKIEKHAVKKHFMIDDYIYARQSMRQDLRNNRH